MRVLTLRALVALEIRIDTAIICWLRTAWNEREKKINTIETIIPLAITRKSTHMLVNSIQIRLTSK